MMRRKEAGHADEQAEPADEHRKPQSALGPDLDVLSSGITSPLFWEYSAMKLRCLAEASPVWLKH